MSTSAEILEYTHLEDLRKTSEKTFEKTTGKTTGKTTNSPGGLPKQT